MNFRADIITAGGAKIPTEYERERERERERYL